MMHFHVKQYLIIRRAKGMGTIKKHNYSTLCDKRACYNEMQEFMFINRMDIFTVICRDKDELRTRIATMYDMSVEPLITVLKAQFILTLRNE
jgi:hypothetical protein